MSVTQVGPTDDQTPPAAPQRNGQRGFLMVPGVPTRLAQLLVVVPDMNEGEQLMPFLAGNGDERPN